MKLNKHIKVKVSEDETRLDRWLKRKFSSLNQSYIEKNLRKGIIKVNNKKVKANYIVKADDLIIIFGYDDKKFYTKKNNINSKKIPEDLLVNFNKSIIFENINFFILNKWGGICTQGGSKVKISIDDIISHISKDYRLVHRLDKETSGLLIIAKNLKAAKIFAKLFSNQKIEKIYVSVSNGIPKNLSSVVKLNIKTKKIYEEVQTITKYSVIHNNKKLSLILFKPLTGKTHQLRIVSKHLNAPIVGDKKYSFNNELIFEKLKLHACFLRFNLDNENFIFTCELPKHFKNFLEKNKLKSKIKNQIYFFSKTSNPF